MAGGTGSHVPGIEANARSGGSRVARALPACVLVGVLAAVALSGPAAQAETVYAPAPAPSAPAPATAGVPNTRLSRTSINAGHGTAQFAFTGVGAVTGFECVLVKRVKKRHGGPPSFGACSSPQGYRNLGSGRYVFKVRAYGPRRLRRDPGEAAVHDHPRLEPPLSRVPPPPLPPPAGRRLAPLRQ